MIVNKSFLQMQNENILKGKDSISNGALPGGQMAVKHQLVVSNINSNGEDPRGFGSDMTRLVHSESNILAGSKPMTPTNEPVEVKDGVSNVQINE